MPPERDGLACPTCEENIASDEYDEAEGFVTFYDSLNFIKAEGHFECPACGNPIYVDTQVQSIERG